MARIPPEEMSGKMGFQKTALKEGPMPKQRLLRERHTETIGRRFFLMLSLVAALGIGILALVLDRGVLPS